MSGQQGRRKTAVIIAGPTAVGKTAYAIEVAHRLGTQIISADSRQCYSELNIGVARPDKAELEAVPHHFIADRSIHQKTTVADFELFALNKAGELLEKHDHVVVVGGTGLYLKAFGEGMDSIPAIPVEIRQDLMNAYQSKGLLWLQQQVAEADPEFYKIAETLNPHRLLRALEVKKATGKSILSFRTGQKAERPFRQLKIALTLSKETLRQRIDMRVDRMMQNGLLEEVRSLLPYQHLNALQTVGYRELFDFFNGKMPLPEAVDLIKRNTRQYAKRQLTWFKKDLDYHWISPDDQKGWISLLRAGALNEE
jgi:tRNA dimethylallyltransferase